MVSNPLVSVLMTAYNREEYIAEAIESVLESTYRNFELIIVDDCSNDKTVEIAKSFELKDARVKVYINENNLGDYPNRNKAATYAKGKYIKYLDSDDIMYPHCLQVMLNAMEQFPEAGFGLSAIGDPLKHYPTCISPFQSYIEHFNGYGHFDRAPGSSIIKKDAFNKVNGFSGVRMVGDNEFWFRIGRYFPLVKFPVDLYWARIHEGQESKSDYAKEYDLLRKKVIKEAFTHIDCPLSNSQKIIIQEKIKKQLNKNKFLKFFR